MALQRCPEVPPSAGRWDVGFCRCSSERSMWSVAAECTPRCYSKVRARRKMHRGASAGASCIKTLVFPACSLCSCFLAAPEAAGGTGLSPLKPPAQAEAASAAVGAVPSGAASSGSERKQSRRSEPATRSGSKAAVRCKNRVATHRIKKLGLYHVSRCAPWRFGITSRARATLSITAARASPHAGRWESFATRRSYREEPRTACVPASLETQSRAG